MPKGIRINNSTIRLLKGDIADLETDSIVFYARDDLTLGSGFGTAINIRGGPTVRKELQELGPLRVTEVVATTAGDMKTKHIVHADGPKFQEENMERKLETTIANAMKCAEEKGAQSIAFPPMGSGFYGVPLDTSARVTVRTIARYMKETTGLREIVICVIDNREHDAFLAELDNLIQ